MAVLLVMLSLQEARGAGDCLYPVVFEPTYDNAITVANEGEKVTAFASKDFGEGDFNGDGHLDLALPYLTYDASTKVDTAWIGTYVGSGQGTLMRSTRVRVPGENSCCDPADVQVADFNNDGFSDLLVEPHFPANHPYLFLNRGDGTFETPSEPIWQLANPGAFYNNTNLVVLDINGDGNLDLIAGGYEYLGVGDGEYVPLKARLGDGTGAFGSPIETTGVVGFITVADFNGDGMPDVMTTLRDRSGTALFTGNGDGSFVQSATYSSFAPFPLGVGDFTGDGYTDFVTLDGHLHVGDGQGGFVRNYLGIAPWEGYLKVADYNRDGNLDVGTFWYIYLGDGSGNFPVLLRTFQDPLNSMWPYSLWPYQGVLIDLNDDGWPDQTIVYPRKEANLEALLLPSLRDCAPAPQPGQIVPRSGASTGGQLHELRGQHLSDGTDWGVYGSPLTVSVGGKDALAERYQLGTYRYSSRALAPGVYDVTVRNFDGQEATLVSAYTSRDVSGSFTIKSVVGNDGTAEVSPEGTPRVTIRGSGFEPGVTVEIGGLSAPVVSSDSGSIYVKVPLGDPGPPPIKVTNPSGDSVTAEGALEYWLPVTGVLPANGPSTGGTKVTIFGRGFKAGATVGLIGGWGGYVPCPVTAVTRTEIHCVTTPVLDVSSYYYYLIRNGDGVERFVTQFQWRYDPVRLSDDLTIGSVSVGLDPRIEIPVYYRWGGGAAVDRVNIPARIPLRATGTWSFERAGPLMEASVVGGDPEPWTLMPGTYSLNEDTTTLPFGVLAETSIPFTAGVSSPGELIGHIVFEPDPLRRLSKIPFSVDYNYTDVNRTGGLLCVTVQRPLLVSPANDASDTSTSLPLEWELNPGDYRYDVYLGTSPSPTTVIASNLAANSIISRNIFVVSNLQPNTRYYWKVVATGDPGCPAGEESSEIFSFTTGGCINPAAFDLTAPANSQLDVPTTATLSWESAPGASAYDLFLGSANPPSLYKSGLTSNSISVSELTTATTYYWSVVAHASCDASKTTSTPVRSFTVTGDCTIPAAFGLSSPADGASLTTTSATLSWNSSSNATGYDLYLGTTTDPALSESGLSGTSAKAGGLASSTTYYWKIVARAACDRAEDVSSTVFSFTTGKVCNAPSSTSFVFLPPGSVGVGQTYTIAWKGTTGIGEGGHYEVQRALESGFSTILDTQKIDSTFATFVADEVGTYYHRVRAVAGCDATKVSTYSPAGEVTVVKGRPSVVFTVQPEAEITELNADLSATTSRFVLENISPDPVTVIIGRQEINSESFFTIVDPEGSDGFLTLDPRTPKEMEIRFAGPSTDTTGSYQGVIFLASTSTQLTITPYAFVNLKVGGQTSVTPQFIVDGAISSYAFFPPWSGDDSTRPGLEIGIRNPGSTPMELGAEIGPEVWLIPEDGWNATPLAAGEARTVTLFTQRNRAPAGSPLPRYTYFTIRTRDGKTARLLVQDNDESSIGTGRATALAPGERSLIVPDVVSNLSPGLTPLVTQLHLTNMGTSGVQTDLYFTPSGDSGFSQNVKRVTVVVPPNDVVTLIDPLVQLFGLAIPAQGQIEVRASQETLGLLKVKAGVVSARGTAAALSKTPVTTRGEGARAGSPHRLVGVTKSATGMTAVVLAETTGTEQVTVQLRLYDQSGTSIGEQSYVVEPYGHRKIEDVVAALGGGSSLDGGRVIVTVTSGGGAVVALGQVRDAKGENTATVISKSLRGGGPSSSAKTGGMQPYAESTTSLMVPMVVQGPIDSTDATQYETLVGFVAPAEASASFTAVFTSSAGSSIQKTVSVPAGQTVEHKNVVSQLFSVTSPAVGSMTVQASDGAQVYSWLVSDGTQTGSVPVINTGSTLVSSATGSSSPLHFDGMEQSTDPGRGTRWNLYIQETAGQSGKVRVSLYESSNRTYPIIEEDFSVAAGARVPLESVFAATGLDSDLRRKDRTNVLCVVRPTEGSAAITATAVEIDNLTGAVQVHPLEPGTGLSSTFVTVSTGGGLGGDANGDGTVTVSDIFYLINHLFAGGPGPVGSGDANGDGAVSVADIFYLINHLFAGGPAPV